MSDTTRPGASPTDLPEPALPADAMDRCSHPGLRAAARRELEVFGIPVELCLLPTRGARSGAPTDDRPALRPDRAGRILAGETVWPNDRAGELALTPNRFPFAERQMLLWTRRPEREPTDALLRTACAFVDATVNADRARFGLWNSIGAAASIPRAHVHLIEDVGGRFLTDPPEIEADDWSDVRASLPEGAADGVEVRRLDLPVLVYSVRGSAADRARAARWLLHLRTAPAANLVIAKDRCYIAPRREEIPAPEFPHALGAAEVWGRWCFVDERAFARATADGLERAMRRCLFAT